MSSVLFLDHEFHRKTKSSEFFVDLLRRHFIVEQHYVDPHEVFDVRLIDLALSHHRVVIWQMDYLAPAFILKGIPTVVIPMFDGSSELPDLHWSFSRNARFISFSYSLHLRLIAMRCKSLAVKYFVPPKPENEIADFSDGLRVFLWQRRPNEGINLNLVERLFGDQVCSVHIHDVPDDALNASPPPMPTISSYTLSTSKWLPTRNRYEALLSQANVFVAPRMAEGIGMAMLEAMARGMLIVAHDLPTHSEYISNWSNGVLTNVPMASRANFSSAPRLGRLAWRTAQIGHERWLASEKEIVYWIRTAPSHSAHPSLDINQFARALSRAYSLGVERYTAFLASQLSSNNHTSAELSETSFDDRGNEHQPKKDESRSYRGENFAWIENGSTIMGKQISNHVTRGEVVVNSGYAWVKGFGVEIGCRFDPSAASPTRLLMEMRHCDFGDSEQTIMISVNDRTLGVVRSSAAGSDFKFDAYLPRQSAASVIKIQALTCGAESELSVPVALGIQTIQFT